MAGVGVLTVVLFVLKHPGYSRLLVFSFALLSGLLLAAGRYAAAAGLPRKTAERLSGERGGSDRRA
jgi:ABC-type nickel/cobalt efflux system permease component RcnA